MASPRAICICQPGAVDRAQRRRLADPTLPFTLFTIMRPASLKCYKLNSSVYLSPAYSQRVCTPWGKHSHAQLGTVRVAAENWQPMDGMSAARTKKTGGRRSHGSVGRGSIGRASNNMREPEERSELENNRVGRHLCLHCAGHRRCPSLPAVHTCYAAACCCCCCEAPAAAPSSSGVLHFLMELGGGGGARQGMQQHWMERHPARTPKAPVLPLAVPIVGCGPTGWGDRQPCLQQAMHGWAGRLTAHGWRA